MAAHGYQIGQQPLFCIYLWIQVWYICFYLQGFGGTTQEIYLPNDDPVVTFFENGDLLKGENVTFILGDHFESLGRSWNLFFQDANMLDFQHKTCQNALDLVEEFLLNH